MFSFLHALHSNDEWIAWFVSVHRSTPYYLCACQVFWTNAPTTRCHWSHLWHTLSLNPSLQSAGNMVTQIISVFIRFDQEMTCSSLLCCSFCLSNISANFHTRLMFMMFWCSGLRKLLFFVLLGFCKLLRSLNFDPIFFVQVWWS